MALNLNVKRYLTHVAQWKRGTLTKYTDINSLTLIATISCFAYYKSIDRDIGDAAKTSITRMEIIVPGSLSTNIGSYQINEGDSIVAVVDKDGYSVYAGGIVDRIEAHRHHKFGTRYHVLSMMEL